MAVPPALAGGLVVIGGVGVTDRSGSRFAHPLLSQPFVLLGLLDGEAMILARHVDHPAR